MTTHQQSSKSTLIRDIKVLISSYPKGSKRRLGIYIFCGFISSVLDLVGIAAILPIMQVILGASFDSGYLEILYRLEGEPTRNGFVVITSILMIVAFFLKGIFVLLITWWGNRLIARLQLDTSVSLLENTLMQPYLVYRQHDVGEMMRNISGSVSDAHTRVLAGIVTLTSLGFSIILLLGFTLIVMPGATLVALIYFGLLLVLVSQGLAGPNRRAGLKNQKAAWRVNNALIESLSGFREISIQDAQRIFLKRYHRHAEASADAGREVIVLNSIPKVILEFMAILGISLLLVFVTLTSSATEMIPSLTLLVAVVVKLLPAFSQAIAALGTIRSGEAGLSLVVENLQKRDTSVVLPTPLPIPDHQEPCGISVRDVSFRYPDGNVDVLSHINLEIPAGSSFAVVGLSGSGKTTLVDIILGLISPTSGMVIAEDLDTAASSPEWHSRVAYIPQDVYIIDDSFAVNIAFGLPEETWDIDRMNDAIDKAQLREVIDESPDGLNTRLGGNGKRISGGQRQRVGIARALYRNPAVLVLDEATSALDNETEHHITQTMEMLHGKITTITVAHRLSTIKNADQIAFIENGRLTASGTFREVQEISPSFAHLVSLGDLKDPVAEPTP